jgi:hypothetical protein
MGFTPASNELPIGQSSPVSVMDLAQASAKLPLLLLRLRIRPKQTLKLPADNKGNTLRGAFGSALRKLVCIPQCRDARQCPLDGVCPYRVTFEPSPPPGADRLSKNQDTPRPFIFRPPLGSETTYRPGDSFDFTLTLLGRAVHYLPYFVLAFREVTREGIGLNRAACELEQVEALAPENAGPETWPASPANLQVVYDSEEDLFRQPPSLTLADWVRPRLHQWTDTQRRFTISFLTPTYLKFKERAVLKPDFHHLFKRVRDRLNALCTFFGPGPIDADFKALGERAEQVRTVEANVHWRERSRRSSKTGQRHELSGFIGECIYEFPPAESESCNLELLRWIICGEFLHAGRHTAWGNGCFRVNQGGLA